MSIHWLPKSRIGLTKSKFTSIPRPPSACKSTSSSSGGNSGFTSSRSNRTHRSSFGGGGHAKDGANNSEKSNSGWFSWRSVIFRWTPIGFCLIAVSQWNLHNHRCDKLGLPRTATQWQTSMYCSLPLRLISRCWGFVAGCQIPTSLRPIIFGAYSNTFGVDIEEAECSDFKNYRSMSEFFTRSLRDDARQIDHKSCLVSPADGRILHFGLADNERIEQVKGVTYSLESFLGSKCETAENSSFSQSIMLKPNDETQLYQCVVYLAPGDYHRFHSPANWQPQLRRHISGELLSVSPRIAKWVPGLFCLNERALYVGSWEHGFFSFAAVGATNVGSVEMFIDEELRTNRWHGVEMGAHKKVSKCEELSMPKDMKLSKGQLLGQFNMGSTIVLVFEAPKNFEFSLEPGQKIKVGQRIGCVGGLKKEANS